MQKKADVLEQTIFWILIIIIGLVIGWGVTKLIRLASERGLPAIFG